MMRRIVPRNGRLGRTLLGSGAALVAAGGFSVGLLTVVGGSAPSNGQTPVKAAPKAAPTAGTGRTITLPPPPSTSTTSEPTTAPTASSPAPTNTAPTNTAPQQTTPPAANAAAPSTLTTTSPSGFTVLAPATIPPKVAECTQQLSYGTDGTVGPLVCSGDSVNVLAWNYYTQFHSPVMTLGPYATPTQVLQAMCSNMESYPIADDIESLSAAYYGWNFTNNFDLEMHDDAACST